MVTPLHFKKSTSETKIEDVLGSKPGRTCSLPLTVCWRHFLFVQPSCFSVPTTRSPVGCDVRSPSRVHPSCYHSYVPAGSMAIGSHLHRAVPYMRRFPSFESPSVTKITKPFLTEHHTNIVSTNMLIFTWLKRKIYTRVDAYLCSLQCDQVSITSDI